MPINSDTRLANYRKQTGRPELTPRQRRRAEKKEGTRRAQG
ncbi:hypothetical protein SAMN05444365_104394 [Micromonospora pattaloongensis]|uniref:Uncharacterized protein n=1 Tax=Micromonospora pattaloongensis TaxID=405436 RepID=A0A1H3P9F4_9ACTN|nr:hypothetical protein [Micromonospora pattaloongensis]SDY97717.1 hypothetical protein SAMN05444365_104394 [Micromonospora pattaloongensis]